ncbi:UDP-N-acetylglucosamine acyltransferase [Pseudomonas asplenii]|uniref:UDP-N-acetylglucosamine acyltransferase n=1 Tax=Pseudomonas asplenii TaxID=53407 RepID=UPI0037CAC5DF
MQRIAIGALLISFLAGCASAPPLNFSVQDVSPSTRKLDADLRAVSVSYAAPNEQTGSVPSDGEAIPGLWERAVVEAINKSSLFDDESTKKVNLFVKIQELHPPLGGATMTTDASAKYLLVNRKTGETVFEETITNQGVVPPGYAFSGYVRIKESVNRAVQNNIREFLRRLEARK